MRSVMSHNFSQVPKVEIQRSRFNRNHGHKTTFNAGWLVPVLVDEALPGDTVNCRMAAMCRMSTPIFPVMDNMYIDSFFFAIPIRLIWNNFEKFMGAQANPGDSISYLIPTTSPPAGGYIPPQGAWSSPSTAELAGALAGYMGIPTKVANFNHSVLFQRAYNLVWNQWFRDENMQNSVPVALTDGPDTYTDYVLLRRGKRHDYFTSALPWPQKGPTITIPIGTTAPVKGIGTSNTPSYASSTSFREAGASVETTANVSSQLRIVQREPNSGYPNVYADLSAATAATINQLRQAFQIQRLQERDARGGTRYPELIHSHFGVTSDDARLNRPEYLGGSSSEININPVAQTSANTGQPTPQGNMSAFGTAHLDHRMHGFTKSFTEHCVIIGLVSVRADLTYQQGLDRMFTRSTRYDFYWPSLAMIGEQAILNKEIYLQGSTVLLNGTPADEQVFGYQERYAEYRYKNSRISGQFRSNETTPLDAWHLSQKFTSLPVLGNTFIQDNPPIERVVAVPSQPHFIFDSYFEYTWGRPMPMYGVPGNIDRF